MVEGNPNDSVPKSIPTRMAATMSDSVRLRFEPGQLLIRSDASSKKDAGKLSSPRRQPARSINPKTINRK
ncbi:MAF protein [Anopheles sinensis]|uniref:MAF protein n=1 Tax=Anopheles sinensis TaxID=74873 RepID=A0A084W8J5_ANOSI|nr:MAF protein [Anopheles sinensis]